MVRHCHLDVKLQLIVHQRWPWSCWSCRMESFNHQICVKKKRLRETPPKKQPYQKIYIYIYTKKKKSKWQILFGELIWHVALRRTHHFNFGVGLSWTFIGHPSLQRISVVFCYRTVAGTESIWSCNIWIWEITKWFWMVFWCWNICERNKKWISKIHPPTWRTIDILVWWTHDVNIVSTVSDTLIEFIHGNYVYYILHYIKIQQAAQLASSTCFPRKGRPRAVKRVSGRRYDEGWMQLYMLKFSPVLTLISLRS